MFSLLYPILYVIQLRLILRKPNSLPIQSIRDLLPPLKSSRLGRMSFSFHLERLEGYSFHLLQAVLSEAVADRRRTLPPQLEVLHARSRHLRNRQQSGITLRALPFPTAGRGLLFVLFYGEFSISV